MFVRPKTLRLLVPLSVLVIAAGIRFWHLSSPQDTVWDEHYYAFDAEAYLGGWIADPIQPAPPVRIDGETTWVHPPLGKWMIALLGVGPLGGRSLGWRVPAALFGLAGVGLLYLLAMELWGSIWWAGMASLMLALDGLHIVQSRVATLDIFVTTFITAGLYFLARDKRLMSQESEHKRNRLDYRVFGSPSRFWAGIMFGAALATKWSGAFALVFAAALCGVWLLMERRERSVWASVGTLLASFVLVPVVVYMASYAMFFWQHGLDLRGFVDLQRAMFTYQRTHIKVQPENSLQWTWPLLLHPIRYYWVDAGDSVRRIMALGNPVIWWGFLLLLPVAIVDVVRRPTWRHALIFGGYLALFLPWFYIGRSQFIFYMLPAVPLMCLGICSALRSVPAKASTWSAGTMATAVVVAAALYMPLWLGLWIPRSWAEHLRLLHSWPF